MRKQKVICPNCKNIFEEKPKLSLLAFRKFSCPSCSDKFIYPLTSGYRKLYLFLLILFILFTIAAFTMGEVVIPGLLVIGAIIALIKNNSLKKKLQTQGIVVDGAKKIPIVQKPKIFYCSKCGNKLDSDSQFCSKCGAKI